ncbi:hypothetical protein COV49_01535 [Candidatus Falkowbacteria bacterium CG11_big_fil_rev_8_21_14_0_20_39_10]|uniref:Uncharacterized protein n=1 Tax=Candidatus Falkowbacteria bacterium CG11_big_fil_rev_8_21_14_0_20_39_10 TaxID=1974570 RepID=A0A2M6K9E2_9BACT|nr:MAG: hypothetical protein COV49_01535 [Candidatus Falkowbacteria bacterium CG11_big_fil_rev_8_21_14_0_20_39_10]
MRKYKRRKKPKVTNFFALILGNIRPPKNKFARSFICGYREDPGEITFLNGRGSKIFSLPFGKKELVIL